MTPDGLRDGIFFLGPGFLALKIFYLFGAQRPRSEWEWTTWSVLASLPLVWIASWVAPLIADKASLPPGGVDTSLRFFLALVAGMSGAWAWRRLRSSTRRAARWIRIAVTDSAWDQALDDANLFDRPIEIVTTDGSCYRGRLRYGGREDTQAEGWMYLVYPDVRKDGCYRPVRGAHGLLVHRDKIDRIRVFTGPYDPPRHQSEPPTRS